MDFKDEDNIGGALVWPIYIEKHHGTLYGFCPGKANWDSEARAVYQLLKISAMTGALLVPGGLMDQPGWYLDLLGWFLPRYDDVIFSMKAERVLKSPAVQTLKGG